MTEHSTRIPILTAAVLTTLLVLAIDCLAGLDFSVSVLYCAPLVLVARAGTRRWIAAAALLCTMLAVASWWGAHGERSTIAGGLGMLNGCIAVLVTGVLLASRKRLREARDDFERSRAEVEHFANSVPHILWRANAKGEIIYFNARVTEVTGLDRVTALDGQSYMEALHPEDRGAAAEAVATAVANHTKSNIYARLRQADGGYRWMHLYDQPVRSPLSGEIERFGGASDVHDEIEGRREMARLREQLEQSREDLQHFTDSVPQILWRATPDAHVDYYNRRYTEIIGRDFNETIERQDWIEDVHPTDREPFLERIRISFAAGVELRHKYRLRHADGSYRWMSIVGRPVRSESGEVIRYYGGTTDVHDDVMAQEELVRLREEVERSRTELQNFTDSVPQVLWRAGADGPVEYFNRRHTDLTGQPVEEAVREQGWLRTIHPEDRDRVLASLIASRGGASELRCRYRMLHVDGGYRWMSVYARPVFSADGTMLARYGGAVDVHDEVLANEQVRLLNETLERRVAERTDELARTQARYAGLFDVSNMTFAEMDFSATQPMLDVLRESGVTDLRTYMSDHPDEFAHCLSLIRTTRVNEALARMMGYESVAELVANPPAQNADDGPAVLLRQLEMYYYGIDHIDGRTVLMGKNERRIPVYFTVNRMADGLHLSSHVDLSEQERIDELHVAAMGELARANRVATVGAFSASIAHELNQPIASMVMDAQTGLRWIKRDEPDIVAAERSLERLSRTAQRVAGIVKRTRDSIVAGRRVVKSIDLVDLAMETRELLERDMRRAGVTFQITCEGDIPMVLGDPVELQQVFVNLASNAADAMLDQDGDRRIDLTIRLAGDGVCVEFADTGPGLPDMEAERLFEPFFTTKATGIGMGLQICRSAVESLGGQLTARNGPDGGALFAFSLPVLSITGEDAEATQ